MSADLSLLQRGDGSPLEERDGSRCTWCGGPMPTHSVTQRRRRQDATQCRKSCRQAAYKFRRRVQRAELDELRMVTPLRLGLADPPYPGLAHYYRGHPDYAGEVDHKALLAELATFDGWALSTSADALPMVLGLCAELELCPRVAAWTHRARPGPSRAARSGWEPVLFVPARTALEVSPPWDALVCTGRPRRTDPKRVIGAKPAAFCSWVFRLLQARPVDTLADLFPGSGGVSRAWAIFTGRADRPQVVPPPG